MLLSRIVNFGLQVLPPVPQIEAVLVPHQTPHAVGVISSVSY